MIDAGLAHAALCVPDLAAGAFVHGELVAVLIKLDNRRNSRTSAAASILVPEVAFRACLLVAGTLALLGIPVVGVVLASLRFTDVGTLFGVPGHDEASRRVGVRCLEDTFAFLAIPEVVQIASAFDLHLTVFHVEVLILKKSASEHAAAVARIVAPEVENVR